MLINTHAMFSYWKAGALSLNDNICWIVKKYLKWMLPVVKNKYFIASFAFLILITFFDNDNLLDRATSMRKLRELERQREFYHSEIERCERQLHELMTDNENLEKFAREEYLMKKPDEDIFIIREK